MVAEEVRREINVARALLHAENQLADDPQEPSPRTVDSDWLYRWRDSAAGVSSEEMQHLWGQVLAGELKSPGSYSLRTVEFLKNLAQQEAQRISLLSRFVVEDAIFRESRILADEGINFAFLLEMQALGVIATVESVGFAAVWKTLQPGKFIQVLTSNGKALVVSHDDEQRTITLKAFKLTAVGREVLRLGTFEPHVDYLREVGQAILGQGFRVSLANYIRLSETRIRTFDEEPLSPTAATG